VYVQYLIDASVYVFRAYYSMPDDIVDNDGNPINAFYGFCRFIGDFMEQTKPEHIAILFDDSSGYSFRSEIYPPYKANRDPAPPELKKQFRQCKEYINLLGLMNWSHPNYEADDLIGTLARLGKQEGRSSTIVSRDKDLAQLVGQDDIFWDYSGKGKITYQQIPDVFGVWPEQIADFLALAGDSVDNIPGVPGVGKKTAIALLKNFQDLKSIYGNLSLINNVDIRGAKTLGNKLEKHEDDAFLARKLTGIDCYAPLESTMNLKPSRPDLDGINQLFDQLGVGTALRRQADRINQLIN
jgi:DNA polymerase I